jgi:hypothetical protein
MGHDCRNWVAQLKMLCGDDLFERSVTLTATRQSGFKSRRRQMLFFVTELVYLGELDGPAVSALGMRSRKLSTGLNVQS